MQVGSSMILIMWLLLTVVSVKPIFAEEDSEIMDRSTRPKIFINVDELKEYIDFVHNYYAVKGKARYGKRAENFHYVIDPSDYSRESMRLKPNILEQLFQGILAEKQNQNQQQHLPRGDNPEEKNKLRKPAQSGGVKTSYTHSILAKSNDRLQ